MVLFGIIMLFIFGFLYQALQSIAELAFFATITLLSIDFSLLFLTRNPIKAERIVPNRLSNGDENTILINLSHNYPFTISLELIDEIPFQFQVRNFHLHLNLKTEESKTLSYELRPTERGEYDFGNLNVYVRTFLGLISRRTIIEQPQKIPVYPSFIQMRKFEMYAISNRLTDIGVKKIRRVGHTMEFDQIREYVPGNDIRSINWKATARSASLMVNQYQDERSQQVINVIDMGRVMKMPFDGLKLLDYAINTSLVISNIALLKEDKAGLFTFTNKETNLVKPEKHRTHIQRIQEALYHLDTNFLESNYERLVVGLKTHLKQRSLVLLYTNFETLDSMERQLPYLQRIAKDHLLVTVFFENTELSELLNMRAQTTRDIYTKAVAEQFDFEKRQIVKILNQKGVHTIYSPPKELSVNAINKYLELKARGLI